MVKLIEKRYLEQKIDEFKKDNFNIKKACLDLIYACANH